MANPLFLGILAIVIGIISVLIGVGNLIINELNRRRENFRLAWELHNYREEGRNNRNNVTSMNWIVIIVKEGKLKRIVDGGND